MRWDPKQTKAAVLTWPNDMLHTRLASWLYLHVPYDNIMSLCLRDVVRARNVLVAKHLLTLPKQYTEFLFCDNDVVPGQNTAPFLEADADIVACQVGAPQAWALPHGFHMGLVRIARHVFERIPPPWFQFDYSNDGMRLERCECMHFATLAREAGFTVVRAGWAGHAQDG